MTLRLPAAAGAALAAVLLLSACTDAGQGLAEDYGDGTTENYISGDGSITEIEPDQRAEPVSFEGETDAGGTVSSDDLAGEVVVLNFWYGDCPPCRVEAPDLEQLNQDFAGEGVTFLGVNVQDEAPRSLAFAEEFGITYPSVLDAATNSVQLAFAAQQQVSPNAIPTTLVIDKQGRVAARISGLVREPGILATLIDDALAEKG